MSAAIAALAGTVLGGLISFLTTLYQNRQAQAARENDAAAARIGRAADILGLVRVFLTDANPARLGINLNAETTPTEFEALTVRLNALRDALSVFAAGADDEHLTTRAANLEVALFNAFNQAKWHVSDLMRNRDALASLKVAEIAHLKAQTLLAIVLGLVHGRDVSELEATLDTLDEQE